MLERIAATFGERITAEEAVHRILRDVRTRGDAALRDWSAKLDGFPADAPIRVPAEALTAALEALDPATRAALEVAANRIREFYRRQPLTSWFTNDLGGTLGQFIRPHQPRRAVRSRRHRPAALLGADVGHPGPGGGREGYCGCHAAARRNRGRCTDHDHRSSSRPSHSGRLRPRAASPKSTPWAARRPSPPWPMAPNPFPAVDKIFGPGNLFVTLAKRQVFGAVGIDGLAGPTETVVIADDTAKPAWVAADLLAQAEHDVLACAILLTPSRKLAEAVQVEVGRQMETLPRADILAQSLPGKSGIVITQDLDEAAALNNAYAPEHLCLAVADPWALSEKITNAGGIFMGEHSFEVLGDYVAGPSHVMPTGGSARFASPLNVWDFVHIISLIALNPATTAQIAPLAARIARAEGLEAHARSADCRVATVTQVDKRYNTLILCLLDDNVYSACPHPKSAALHADRAV